MSRYSIWNALLAVLLFSVEARTQAYDPFGPEVVIDFPDTVDNVTPRLYRDENGVLHATMWGHWLGGTSRYAPIYTTSEDNGRTWTAGIAVVDTADVRWSEATRPLVRGDVVYVVWQNQWPYGPGDMWFASKSLDADSFTHVTRIATDLRRLGPLDLVETRTGRLIYHYYQERWRPEYGYDNYVAWSDDGGASWTVPPEPLNMGHPSWCIPKGAIATSANGDVYVVLSDLVEGVLWCYRSEDDGEMWVPWPIKDRMGEPALDVAVNEEGVIGVAWDETLPDVGTSAVFFSQSFDRGETWTMPVRISPEEPAGNFSRPDLAGDARGSWHVVMMWGIPWTQIINTYYTLSIDGGVSWLSPPVLLSEEELASAEGRSLVTDDEGHAFAMWVRKFAVPEQHVMFRTNAPPRFPVPDVLQPNDQLLVRPERNPSGPAPAALLYQLAEPGSVEAFLWDSQGRLVRQWELGATAAGEHRLEWDGRDDGDQTVAAGVYHWELRVASPDGSETVRTKAVLLQ